MGAGGIPNKSVKISTERSLKITGTPNSRVDKYKEGKKIQSRWYDNFGRAVRNRDYEHQNAHDNHFFPHDHSWVWQGDKGKRGKEPIPPDYDNYN